MMGDHPPTTEQVRRVFARDGIGAVSEGNGNRFDCWHAAEMRKAKAEALREAANHLLDTTSDLRADHPSELSYINCTRMDVNELRRLADEIEENKS